MIKETLTLSSLTMGVPQVGKVTAGANGYLHNRYRLNKLVIVTGSNVKRVHGNCW
jgi:hypothetical protein